MVFSPDGAILASAACETTIRLWETATGKELRQLEGHEGGIDFLSISRDGKILTSVSFDDGTVRFWDVASGKERRRRVREPEADRLPRDVASGKERRQVGGEWVCAISPGGRWYAAAPYRGRSVTNQTLTSLRIRDMENGKEVRRLEGVNGHWCAFSPDGRNVAVGNCTSDVLEILQKEIHETILLVELATGQVRARFTGHLGLLTGAAFSPDGRRLASVSSDTTGLIWDVTGRLQDGRLKEAPFSPKELDSLWADLAGADAGKAFRAVWALVAASKQAMPLLRQRLRPAVPADDKQIARWIADLDRDDFKVREQARQALEKLEDLAEHALRRAVAKPSSLEARRRAAQLLEKLENDPLSPKRLQILRAIEVLEHIGTLEARRLLESLAEGTPPALQTREAKAALERLPR